jgi:hypothetical protein
MNSEELLSFANEDEEPILLPRYVPSFNLGEHGKMMLVLVGKTSKNRFLNSKKFGLHQQSMAEMYLRAQYNAWKERQEAKKKEAPIKKPS